MKNYAFLIMAGLLFTGSCKKENTTEVVATEAEATKEAPSASVRYIADPAASKIEWTGSKPTGKHTGIINIGSGEVFVRDGMIEAGKFTIDMKSITVKDLEPGEGKEDLEAHLKGLKAEKADHFFNTNKYPTASFEITGIIQNGADSQVEGNLIIKGIAKNIKFPAKITVTDTEAHLESKSFTIDRTLWDVNYNSKSVVDNLGNEYIDDDIGLKVSVTARK